ncbi:MAG: MotA/TolQ/ExbB proton channel family protein [Verrucomicrobiales bacterium]|nr:MotA/TolQ/ExbB proton channel family protein [Verrucomicrobiales bacterium]
MTHRNPSKFTRWKIFFLSAFFALTAGIAVAQDKGGNGETPSATTENGNEVTKQSALDLYKQGGSFMHVLLICSIGTIAVAVYCFVQVSRKKMVPQTMVDQVNQAMAAKDVNTAYQVCKSTPNSYANVISNALLKVNFDRDLNNKVSMVDAAMEALDEEEHKQMVWVNYLNVFAVLAPMIGLLGTVWGMIEAFDVLTAGDSDPKKLAGGIKIAMVTTAGGLIVGIPSMFFYLFFRDKLQGVITTIQKNASFAIDILSGEIRLEGAETPAAEEVAEAGAEATEAPTSES